MTYRDQFEIAYSRKQGHMVRSRLLFHRNNDGRYCNRAVQLQWVKYQDENPRERAA